MQYASCGVLRVVVTSQTAFSQGDAQNKIYPKLGMEIMELVSGLDDVLGRD